MRKHGSLVVSLALALAAPALVAPGYVAAEEDPKAEAKRHFEIGQQAEKEGRYDAAAAEYGIAYDLIKKPWLFFYLGQAFQKAGKCDAALRYYKRYLKEAQYGEDERKATERGIEACGGSVATGTGAGTEDGTGVGDGTGTGDGVEDGTGVGDGTGTGVGDGTGVGVGDGTGVGDGDGTGDGTGVGDGAGADPSFLDTRTSTKNTVGWIAVGATVAFGTAGAIFAMSASSRKEDLEGLADFRDPATELPASYEGTVRENYENLADEGEKFDTWSTIAFAAAGASAALAVTMFVLDRGSGAESGSALSISPAIAPGQAGVLTSLRF